MASNEQFPFTLLVFFDSEVNEMHIHSMDKRRHLHDFCPEDAAAEKEARRDMAIIRIMIAVEVATVAGVGTQS